MIATAPFAPGHCRSCRADPVAPGACASVMLSAPGAMVGPRQIDRRHRQNKRLATAERAIIPARADPIAAQHPAPFFNTIFAGQTLLSVLPEVTLWARLLIPFRIALRGASASKPPFATTFRCAWVQMPRTHVDHLRFPPRDPVHGNAAGSLFPGAVKQLNFTRTAEECNVTQPALTRAIQNLEYELGGELIRRERQRSHLT